VLGLVLGEGIGVFGVGFGVEFNVECSNLNDWCCVCCCV